jgi:hypothetical protein
MRSLRLLPLLAALLLALPGCGEEKVYVDGLVGAARAAETQDTRQKLEQVGAALDRYALDHSRYPDAASLEEAQSALVPSYTPSLPRTDGWGRPLRLRSGEQNFVVSSDGQDGAADTGDDLRREAGQRVNLPTP